MTASLWIIVIAAVFFALSGIYFLIRTTSRDDRQTIDLAILNVPVGKVSLSLGLVLLAISAAIVVFGLPELERVQQASLVKTLEAEKASRDAIIKARDEQIAELEGDVDEKDGTIAELNEESRTKNVRISQLNGEIHRLEEEIKRKDAALDETAETIRQAILAMQSGTAQMALLREKLRAAEAEAANAVQVVRDIASAAGEADLSVREHEELRRVREGIGEINAGLSRIALREAPLLKIVGRLSVANYEIYARRFADGETDALDRGYGLFEFESERFTLESHYGSGEIERMLSEIAPALCGAVNASIAEDVSLEDAILRIPALEKYEGVPEQLLVLAEYAYLRLKLQALAVDAEVFVRGYADGERSGWARPLPPRSPERIEVHPLANPDVTSPLREWRFLAETETRPTGDDRGRYRNDDLPNLRSLTTKALMEEIVANCALPGQKPGGLGTRAGILEGKLDEAHLGTDRKSRAFVSIGLR